MSRMDRVAGAPITWGVCEVPRWGHQLPSDRVLAEMAAIGLRATELGPEGFLPADPGPRRVALAGHGLRLVGGFLPLLLHLEDGLEERLGRAEAYAGMLAASGAEVLVLAASAAAPGYEANPELQDDEWKTLARAVDRVVEMAGDRGLTVAVHPHQGTAIERLWHVERFLEASAASLCLDTGHLMVGGADPLEVVRAAPGRIAHVHAKDVDAAWAERVRTGRSGYREAVRRGLYRPLGAGDLDVGGIVRALHDSGYEGWLVLEQDTVLETPPARGEGPVLGASASLEFLRRVVGELERERPAAVAGGERAAHRATSRAGEEG